MTKMPIRDKNSEKLLKIKRKKKPKSPSKPQWKKNLEKRKSYVQQWIASANLILNSNPKPSSEMDCEWTPQRIKFDEKPNIFIFSSRDRVSKVEAGEMSIERECFSVKSILKHTENTKGIIKV